MDDLPRKHSRTPLAVWVLLSAILLVFAGANAHLVYVALASQPECVPHMKQAGAESGRFRAAKSAC